MNHYFLKYLKEQGYSETVIEMYLKTWKREFYRKSLEENREVKKTRLNQIRSFYFAQHLKSKNVDLSNRVLEYNSFADDSLSQHAPIFLLTEKSQKEDFKSQYLIGVAGTLGNQGNFELKLPFQSMRMINEYRMCKKILSSQLSLKDFSTLFIRGTESEVIESAFKQDHDNIYVGEIFGRDQGKQKLEYLRFLKELKVAGFSEVEDCELECNYVLARK